MSRRWALQGIFSNLLMPGGIWTNLQRHWDSELLAASPLAEGIGGRYFEDCNEAEVVPEMVDGVHGVRDYALDPAAAERLWEVS